MEAQAVLLRDLLQPWPPQSFSWYPLATANRSEEILALGLYVSNVASKIRSLKAEPQIKRYTCSFLNPDTHPAESLGPRPFVGHRKVTYYRMAKYSDYEEEPQLESSNEIFKRVFF